MSLASVSVRMPVCSPRTAAAAADGARPITWPPSLVQARCEGAHSGGFPGAGGGDRQLQPRPEVHICRTSEACPASRPSCSPPSPAGQIHRRPIGGDAPSDGRRRRRDAARRRGSAARCRGGAGDGVDRGAVDPPQHLRFLDASSGAARATTAIEHLVDQQVHQAAACRRHVDGRGPAVVLRRGHATSARSSGSPPSRPGRDRPSVRPSGRRRSWRSRRRGQPSHHRRDGATPPSNGGFVEPGARCSARDRGSCLASRVSKVACCARCNASTGSAVGHDHAGIGWPARRGGC